MTDIIRVLQLEDDATDAELIHRRLTHEGLYCEFVSVHNKDDFELALVSESFDVILCDFSIPGYDGMEALRTASRAAPDVPVVMVSGVLDEGAAVACVKAGATDYVFKERLQRLGPAVSRVLREAEEHRKRRAAEQAVRESERFLRACLNALAAHVAVLDEDGAILTVNAAWRQCADAHGAAWFRPGEGANYLDVCEQVEGDYAEPARALARGIRDVAAGRRDEVVAELRYPGSADVRWFLCRVGRIPGVAPMRVVLTQEDITLVKEGQAEVERAKERFETLAEASPAGIFQADPEGRCVYVNTRWLTFTGMTLEAALGDGWVGAVHGDDRERIQAAWARSVSAQQASQEEFRFRSPDGRVTWVDSRALPLRDHTGRFVGYVGSMSDVTKRRQTEEALRTIQVASARGSDVEFHVYLVQRLVEILGVEFGFVGVLADDKGERLRTLAWWRDGRLAANVEFAVAGTPCEGGVDRRAAIVPADLPQRFPDASMLIDLGAVSYAGVPLFGQRGQSLGLIAVMSRGPLASPDLVEGILNLLAVPAAREIERRRSEQQFRDLFEFSPEAAIMADRDGVIRLMNRQAEQLFGYDQTDLRGRPIEWLVAESARPALADLRRRCLPAGGSRALAADRPTLAAARKDGEVFPAEFALGPLETVEGPAVLAVVRDMTASRRHEERMATLSRIHTVLSSMNSAMLRIRDRRELFDETCRIAVEQGGFPLAVVAVPVPGTAQLTAAACRRADTGASRSDVAAFPIEEGVSGVAGAAWQDTRVVLWHDQGADAAPDLRSQAAFPLTVGDTVQGVLVLYATAPGFFDGEAVKLLRTLAGDISFALDRIRNEERLDRLASYDVLTNLPNRTLFLERSNQILSLAYGEGKASVLIVMDIERFRQVNDSLGRHAGDMLLQSLGLRLKADVSESAVVSRLSADCFALLVPGVSGEADAAKLCEDLIARTVRQPFELEGNEYHLAARAGLAMAPTNGTDAETLLKNAEAALSRAKHSGEQRLFYEPQMNVRVTERLTLENRLRRAIDREQFRLHYQPKFDARTKALKGVEALIRWEDPDRGVVAPGAFVPVLEETGMILEVGRWALDRSLMDLRSWAERGAAPQRVAVNVSASQLRQRDFVDTVQRTIGRYTGHGGLPGGGLDLEITESMIMDDIEQNIPKLRALRDMGVNIHVDDFGTGYSSLRYIGRLPINGVKIDRSFVNNMTTNPDDVTIVSMIISLAHSLNLTVVAEGVETPEQHSLLTLLKCNEVQGFLFSPAVPMEQLAAESSLFSL
ncbi:MAG: EAL domain-containing protein [Nitrospirota bacterium]